MVHKPKIEDEETNHGPQTSTHRANPSKTGGDLRGSGSVNSSCSTSGTCPLTHVETPMISHGQGKTGLMHIYWLHNVYNPDIVLSNHKCLLI
jgi:hypothetical protein